MKNFRKFLIKLSDLKNAYRVLQIMDKCGCDIKKVTRDGFQISHCWEITTKWYVTEEEAKDLQKIVLYKENYYGNHSKIWKIFFRNIKDGCRYL